MVESSSIFQDYVIPPIPLKAASFPLSILLEGHLHEVLVEPNDTIQVLKDTLKASLHLENCQIYLNLGNISLDNDSARIVNLNIE